MKTLKPYTVVGYFEDNGNIWIECVEADDWPGAIIESAKIFIKKNSDPKSTTYYGLENIIVVEVFSGHLKGLTEHDSACALSEFPGV